jgi:energy-coupling factor transport system ATP-binding protein
MISKMSGAGIIKIQNVNQEYGRGESVLKDINLEIKRSELVAVIGQNGAGKTTLVKHLVGLLRPSSGKIYINDRDISKDPIAILAQKVGYVFQNPDHQIFMDRVSKEIAFGLKNLALSDTEIEIRTEKALKEVGMLHLKDETPMSLSKGHRQRLALASVLAMEPEILILDEPTTGQDYRESNQIMELVADLNKKGHTIIFITHDMQLVADYAKRVILMGKGEIMFDGPPKEVLYQTELLAKTNLKPQQITEFSQLLTKHGIPEDIIKVDELAAFFSEKTAASSRTLVNVG